MGRRRVEQLIVPGMKAIEAVMFKGISDTSEWAISAEFKGYIVSFGASIIQNGIVATVSFFENKKVCTVGDRTIINRLIFWMLKDYCEENKLKKISFRNATTLLELVKENIVQQELLTEYIMDSAIALKLALRTYRIVDRKGEEEDD